MKLNVWGEFRRERDGRMTTAGARTRTRRRRTGKPVPPPFTACITIFPGGVVFLGNCAIYDWDLPYVLESVPEIATESIDDWDLPYVLERFAKCIPEIATEHCLPPRSGEGGVMGGLGRRQLAGGQQEAAAPTSGGPDNVLFRCVLAAIQNQSHQRWRRRGRGRGRCTATQERRVVFHSHD